MNALAYETLSQAVRVRAAMQLRVLSTMSELTADKNSTLVFPLPMEVLRLVDTLNHRLQPSES